MKTPPTQRNSEPSRKGALLPTSAEPTENAARFTRRLASWKMKTAFLLQVAAGVAVFLNAPNARADEGFASRGDIVNLPDPLKTRLIKLADRPHTYSPLRVFAEASSPSILFGYYLLDTGGFEPNVFTTTIPGINDGVAPTATGPNGDLPTIASVRLVVEPKPGLPTNPNDPAAFIDIFTDISGLFVINNESGWYEGWMIHDLVVP